MNKQKQVRIVAFNDPFRQEPLECFVRSGQTIAELFPDLSEQVEITVNGRVVPSDEYKDCILLTDDKITMIRYPAGSREGGKNILRTAALLAVAVTATLVSGGTLAPAAFGAVTAQIAGTAVFVGGSMLINTLIPPPDVRSSGGQTVDFTNRGALTGARNAFRQYAPIPRHYGEMRHYPIMSAEPYTEIQGNEQYLRILLNLGPGPLEISEPRIGDTIIGSFDSDNNYTNNGVYQDVSIDVAENPSLYSKDINQQDIGVTLENASDEGIRTTAIGTDEAGIELLFPRGLFGVNNDGDIISRRVGFTVEYRPVGSTDWSSVNGTKTINDCRVGRREDQRGIRIDSYEDCSEIDTGDPVPYYIKNNAKETYRAAIAFDLPDNGQYEIRVRRITPKGNDDQSKGTVFSDSATWTALKSIKHERPTNLPGTVQIAIRIKSTDQLTGVLDQFSVKAKSRLSYFDGTQWQHPTFNPNTGSGTGGVVTSNPAWIMADVFCGSHNPQAISYDKLDGPAFKYWADNYGNKFQYNSVVDSVSTVRQLVTNIAAAGRASWGVQDDVYRPILDEPGQQPIQMFTPRNSSSFSASKTFPQELHGLKLKFRDKENQYQETEHIAYADGYSADGTNCKFDDGTGVCKIATKFQEIELEGVTSWEQAWSLGRYKLAERIQRPEVFTYTTDVEHLRCQRGDLVYMSSDVTLWGSSWGRISGIIRNESNQVITLELDEPVFMQEGKDYNIRVRLQNGSFSLLSVLNEPGAAGEITIETPEEADINEGDLYAFGEDGGGAVPLKVVSIRAQHDFSATLILVDAADSIHNADQAAIPPYDPNITEPIDFESIVPPAPVITDVRSDDSSLYKDEDGTYRLRMLVSYELAEGYPTTEIEARYKPAGSSGGWIGLVKSDASLGVIALPDVTRGKAYDIQIRARYKNNVSGWVPYSTSHIVQGKGIAPSNVTGFFGIVDKTQVRLFWDPVPDSDIEFYEIRTGSSWEDGDFIELAQRSQMTDNITYAGEHVYWIKAVDTSDNYSEIAASTSINVSEKYIEDPLYEGEGYVKENTTPTFNQIVLNNPPSQYNHAVRAGKSFKVQAPLYNQGQTLLDPVDISLSYNSDNLKAAGGQLNTIQDIHPNADMELKSLLIKEGISLDELAEFIQTQVFAGGFAGEGMQLRKDEDGKWKLTIDDIVIRNSAQIYEILVTQLQAFAEFLLTEGHKVEEIEQVRTSDWSWGDTDRNPLWPGSVDDNGLEYAFLNHWDLFIPEDKLLQLAVDDLLLRQDFDGRNAGSTEATIIDVEQGSVVPTDNDPARSFRVFFEDNYTIPQVGYQFARSGNRTDTNRQGGIYFVGTGADAPYQRMYDGVDRHSKFGSMETVIEQFGKLDNLVIPGFSELDGTKDNLYGHYGKNQFLEGKFKIVDTAGNNAATKDYVDNAVGTGVNASSVIRSATAPTTRPNGDALQAGDIWIDASNNEEPHSWDGSIWVRMYTEIQGGYLVTGTVDANKLAFTPTDSSNIVGRINATTEGIRISGDVVEITGQTVFSGVKSTTQVDSDAQGYANSAENNAESYADGKVSNLQSQLGSIAYLDDILDENSVTIIQGGVLLNAAIVTRHLDAGAVTADKLDVTDLSAVSATMGSLIANDLIQLEGGGIITNANQDFQISENGYDLAAGQGSINRIQWHNKSNPNYSGLEDNGNIIGELYSYYSQSDGRNKLVLRGQSALNNVANDVDLILTATRIQTYAELELNDWVYFNDQNITISGTTEQAINIRRQCVYIAVLSGEPIISKITGLPQNGRTMRIDLINESDNESDFLIRDQSRSSVSGDNIRTQNTSDIRVYDGGVISLWWDGSSTLFTQIDRGN